ncbi:unnamed protein product [Fusarium graminearum]|uniref:Heterokaryon incompatibility domain-containing protein n=1 Tax=Gibberella zeae TaxID=5518 RepID=A0A4E9E6W2_GIBZA|nr:unnamed protein product [Fusarium graminearum]CAG2012255.1 unnamed protein product [Fusarium graminearum]
MSRCAFCRTFTITQDRFYLKFHPNLASLKKSAEDGCDFCHLCWRGFNHEWASSEIESVLRDQVPEGVTKFEPGIWIYVHFTDFSPTLSQPWIIVSCGRYNPITSVRESSHGLTYVSLAVYGKDGDASGSRTPGRICTAEYDPDSYITLTQNFLEKCTRSHPTCKFEGRYEMPTRVIDIGNKGDRPRLIVTGPDMKEEFVALSYCWGPATDTFTLNNHTMNEMLKGIDESRLVTAHRETLGLSRQLGFRYIWIDALCIVQGDKQDWERESKLMARVYGNAALTIIAGRSADARNSFITNQYKQLAPCCEFPLADSGSGTVRVGLFRSRDYGITQTRGWCCQERRLSRRVVVFGEEQLFFICRSTSHSEDYIYHKDSTVSLYGLLNATDGDPQLRKDRLLEYWDAVVVDFSKRQLSNPHDVFAALASIAAPISEALGSRYLAGMWECDLIRCLLWRPAYRVTKSLGSATRPKPTRFAPAPVIRAPSWSWAAIQGTVMLVLLRQFRRMKIKDQSGVLLARPKQQGSDIWTVDTCCGADKLHMPSCELQILGHVQEAVVLPETPSLDLLDSIRRQFQKPKATFRHAVLLGRKHVNGSNLSKDLETFVALGMFDFDDEATDKVFCLQLTVEEGLMLRKNDNGTFQRIGLFQPYKDDWFNGVEETEVRLV